LPTLLHFLSTTIQLDEQYDILDQVANLILGARENREASPRAILGVPAIKRLYQVLCENAILYTDYLSSDEPKIRALVAFILGYCTSTTVDLVSCLKTRYEREYNEGVQFALVRAITLLQGYTDEELGQLFAFTNSFFVKHALAVALVEICGDKITTDVEEILAKSLLEDDSLEQVYGLAPYDASPANTTFDALAYLSRWRSVAVLLLAMWQWQCRSYGDILGLRDLVEHLFDRAGFPQEAVVMRLEPRGEDGYVLHFEVRWKGQEHQSAWVRLSKEQYRSLRRLLVHEGSVLEHTSKLLGSRVHE
jgi:hypothetical protein